MEISEQVGMTPEIIQKVMFSPFYRHELLFGYKCSIFFFSRSKMFQYAFFLFAAPRQSYYPHYGKKEGIMLLFYLATFWSITIVVLCNILSHSFNCFTVFLQRGKTVPEELVRAEDLSKYRQVASHAVSIDFCLFENKLHFFLLTVF